MTSMNLSRRSILAGASAVALAAPGPVDGVDPFGAAIASLEGRAPAAGPDPAIAVCARWVKAWGDVSEAADRSAERIEQLRAAGSTDDAISEDPKYRVLDASFSRLEREEDDLRNEVPATPATTLHGVIAKLSAWRMEEEHYGSGGDERFVQSALSDLRRLVHGDAGPAADEGRAAA